MYTIIGVTCTINVAFWFVLMLQCQPVKEFWQRTGKGHCINTDYVINVAYLYSATACICDFILVVTAGHLMKELPMSRWTQWGLTGIISMGCIASAAVVARIPYLHNYKSPEFLYATVNISILSNIEAGLGISAGSLNTVRPLVRWFRGIIYGESRSPDNAPGGIIHCSFNGTLSHPVRVISNSSEYCQQSIEFGHYGDITRASLNPTRRDNSQEPYHESL
jgi:cation-transporting ATPase 13A1